MKRLPLLLPVFLYLFTTLSSAVVIGNNESLHEEAPTFSNKDLEKYKNSPDNSSESGMDIDRKGEDIGRAEKREQREKEYWCKKASVYRKKIDKAEGEMKETEKDRGAAEGRHSKTAMKKLGRAKGQLRDAKIDLRELEDEAHRKGIPPGWLRCQSD